MSEDSVPARVEERVTSPARVVKVTAGLSVFGAVVGAAAGATALFVGTLLTGQSIFGELFVLAVPAVIGAGMGAVLTPIAGWMLLRRVPLGRAFGGLAAGTILGGVLGWWLIPRDTYPLTATIAAAVAGFLIAAVALRYFRSARVAAAD